MRVLVVCGRYPWPPRQGDRLRALQWLAALAVEHEVTLLTPRPRRGDAQAELPPGTRWVGFARRPLAGRAVGAARAWLAGLPLQHGFGEQPALAAPLAAEAREHDVVVLVLARLAAHVGELGGARLVVDLVDALSASFRRRALFDRPMLAPLWRREARRLLAVEAAVLSAATRGVVVCRRERDELAARLPTLAHRLDVVPVAAGVPRSATPSARPRLAITGNLGYFPNRDAAEWWLGEVWPELRRRRPEVELVLAGDRPPAALARRARAAGARLEARPPDLASLLGSAWIALAPLRAGGGVPLKVVEAWACGVPVVASPWAAAGVDGRDGVDLLVASTPADWVAKVEALLDGSERREALSREGRRRVVGRLAPEVVHRQLRETVHAAAAG